MGLAGDDFGLYVDLSLMLNSENVEFEADQNRLVADSQVENRNFVDPGIQESFAFAAFVFDSHRTGMGAKVVLGHFVWADRTSFNFGK